jgi:hypothetical protein
MAPNLKIARAPKHRAEGPRVDTPSLCAVITDPPSKTNGKLTDGQWIKLPLQQGPSPPKSAGSIRRQVTTAGAPGKGRRRVPSRRGLVVPFEQDRKEHEKGQSYQTTG